MPLLAYTTFFPTVNQQGALNFLFFGVSFSGIDFFLVKLGYGAYVVRTLVHISILILNDT